VAVDFHAEFEIEQRGIAGLGREIAGPCRIGDGDDIVAEVVAEFEFPAALLEVLAIALTEVFPELDLVSRRHGEVIQR
jgi:hypothetical protein